MDGLFHGQSYTHRIHVWYISIYLSIYIYIYANKTGVNIDGKCDTMITAYMAWIRHGVEMDDDWGYPSIPNSSSHRAGSRDLCPPGADFPIAQPLGFSPNGLTGRAWGILGDVRGFTMIFLLKMAIFIADLPMKDGETIW